MVFNTVTFVVFFGIFFLLYWIAGKKNENIQNIILLSGSYFFYAWTDWRFLLLLIGISALNYCLGLSIQKTGHPKKRKWLLILGIIQGIGALAFFKYFNFFIASFNDVFLLLGINTNLQTLNIIIPLGISYFTFKTISYLLDVDKGKIEATQNPLVFFNYVAFFPTLLSGPIDSGRSFIPQLHEKRVFNYDLATNGLRQFLWGLFKKMVIADNLALIANPIFEHHTELPATSLLLGAFCFTIQIYADFSGYSDMAIGVGRLIGFNVTKNFDFPFFAQNIADFWRKWHMSLTSWFTEYVFTPLSISFRDYGNAGLIMAIMINFVIIGIWHGANWTFALFGLLHGVLFIPLILKGTMNKRKKLAKDRQLPSFKELLNIIKTFVLVMFTFILFRAENLSDALQYYKGFFNWSSFGATNFEHKLLSGNAWITVFILIFLLIMEWRGKNDQYAIEKFGMKHSPLIRLLLYVFLLFLIGMYSPTNETPFMYLKF